MVKIGFLVEREFEDIELLYPLFRFMEEGYDVVIIGPENKSTYNGKVGYPVESDTAAKDVNVEDFDALIIPGGHAPDYMRIIPTMVELVKKFHESKKIIASICHGPWVMISAKIMKGKRCTSYVAIKDDLENAGAQWVDEPVVIDDKIITSRTPMDLPIFCKTIIAELNT